MPRLITNLDVRSSVITHIDITPTQYSQREEKRRRRRRSETHPTRASPSAAPSARRCAISICRLSPADANAVHPSRFERGSRDRSRRRPRFPLCVRATPRRNIRGGGIRILSSLSSMHRELFCQTIEANRVRRAVAAIWFHRRSAWETARRASGSRC